MKFVALKTNDGKETGKIAFYCRVLYVTRQGFYDYLKNRDKPWKYEALAAEMMEIMVLSQNLCKPQTCINRNM